MFVRRKANKTGSVSVQVIDKRRYRVIKSLGIGNTKAEIVRLEEKARQYIREHTRKNRSLFEDEDKIKLEGFLSNISDSQVQVIGIFYNGRENVKINEVETYIQSEIDKILQSE